MKQRDLLIFLGLEIFAIVWAGTVFTVLNSKLTAGALAGGYFVISGIYMLGRANRWPKKWSSLTWYCLFIHVFGISIPLLVSRFAQMAASFADVQIFGIGPGVSSNFIRSFQRTHAGNSNRRAKSLVGH